MCVESARADPTAAQTRLVSLAGWPAGWLLQDEWRSNRSLIEDSSQSSSSSCSFGALFVLLFRWQRQKKSPSLAINFTIIRLIWRRMKFFSISIFSVRLRFVDRAVLFSLARSSPRDSRFRCCSSARHARRFVRRTACLWPIALFASSGANRTRDEIELQWGAHCNRALAVRMPLKGVQRVGRVQSHASHQQTDPIRAQ